MQSWTGLCYKLYNILWFVALVYRDLSLHIILNNIFDWYDANAGKLTYRVCKI